MVVESNVGGNKDDYWMKRRYNLDVQFRPDGSARHTLKLHYDGLSGFIERCLTKQLWGTRAG